MQDVNNQKAPESLQSRASLCSSAALRLAVLASAVFPERLAPFSPAQCGWSIGCRWEGDVWFSTVSLSN
ncbi:hypothetical protein halTADL_1192 [Halohasta litchfieldiae]|jgi:hypothetical protein|uniref:Uncharacterized protein n=1 Tax=Halohasta litchfieldiae TaxID=1073996 RepID=A0A1H6SC68_9EURY|nr:hypothetical protein halTADL_1192 [Halohasta litchfieldiae]SEI61002.1 hypothetical protein SAMN05444271_1042 [Halohasta litchfieldiae]